MVPRDEPAFLRAAIEAARAVALVLAALVSASLGPDVEPRARQLELLADPRDEEALRAFFDAVARPERGREGLERELAGIAAGAAAYLCQVRDVEAELRLRRDAPGVSGGDRRLRELSLGLQGLLSLVPHGTLHFSPHATLHHLESGRQLDLRGWLASTPSGGVAAWDGLCCTVDGEPGARLVDHEDGQRYQALLREVRPDLGNALDHACRELHRRRREHIRPPLARDEVDLRALADTAGARAGRTLGEVRREPRFAERYHDRADHDRLDASEIERTGEASLLVVERHAGPCPSTLLARLVERLLRPCARDVVVLVRDRDLASGTLAHAVLKAAGVALDAFADLPRLFEHLDRDHSGAPGRMWLVVEAPREPARLAELMAELEELRPVLDDYRWVRLVVSVHAWPVDIPRKHSRGRDGATGSAAACCVCGEAPADVGSARAARKPFKSHERHWFRVPNRRLNARGRGGPPSGPICSKNARRERTRRRFLWRFVVDVGVHGTPPGYTASSSRRLRGGPTRWTTAGSLGSGVS